MGPVISDWRLVTLSNREGRIDFQAEVQRFLNGAMIRGEGCVDLGYERVFDMIDFTSTQRNGFEIVTKGVAAAFKAQKPGQRPQVYAINGPRPTISFDRYGGPLGWEKSWFDDAEFWNIEDATKQFRDSWYDDRSQAFYDLISASRPDADVEWQGKVDQIKSARDAETINHAAMDIISVLASNGYDVNPMTRFVVVVPSQLEGRIQNALTQQNLGVNVEIVATDKIKNEARTVRETSKYFVCLPGRKAKGAYRQPLTLVDEMDIVDYAETVAAWGRYAGIIGDVEQFRRCATA